MLILKDELGACCLRFMVKDEEIGLDPKVGGAFLSIQDYLTDETLQRLKQQVRLLIQHC